MITLARPALITVGWIVLVALSQPAAANPVLLESREALDRLIQIPAHVLTATQKDTLVLQLGSGGGDDLRTHGLKELAANIDALMPIVWEAQVFPKQPSLHLQRLIRQHASGEERETACASLRRWLTEPPDSLYSRARGIVVELSECTVSHLQVIAAEALVEYGDMAADSLIAALLERANWGCAGRLSDLTDRRYLELARLRLRGDPRGMILTEGEGDSLRCLRKLEDITSATLTAHSPTGSGLCGIPLEELKEVLSHLECTGHAPEKASAEGGSPEMATQMLVLRFSDGLTASLMPGDRDCVLYRDDSRCQGRHITLRDKELNRILRELRCPEIVTSGWREANAPTRQDVEARGRKRIPEGRNE